MKKIALPFTFDAIHATIVEADQIQEIKTSVKTILLTTVHERIVTPEFGSRLQDYVFAEVNYTTLELMKNEIITSLQNQEKRITDITVNYQNRRDVDGILFVYVSYRILDAPNLEQMDLQISDTGVHV